MEGSVPCTPLLTCSLTALARTAYDSALFTSPARLFQHTRSEDAMKNRVSVTLLAVFAVVFHAGIARAAADCSAVPTYSQLHTELQAAQAADNGGFDLLMRATDVN